jgi:hypothetical protein
VLAQVLFRVFRRSALIHAATATLLALR